MSGKSSARRQSLVDEVRKTNFLRKSFGEKKIPMTPEDYKILLQEEKQDWSKVLRDEKEAESKRLKPLVLKTENVVGYFSTDDVLFRESRPDYKKVHESAQKYIKTADILKTMRVEFDDYCEEVHDNISVKIDDYLTSLITEKLCYKCNDGYCNTNIHGLADYSSLYIANIDSHFLPEY